MQKRGEDKYLIPYQGNLSNLCFWKIPAESAFINVETRGLTR